MIAPNAVSSDDLGGVEVLRPGGRAARRSTACGSVGERAAEVDDQLVELVERAARSGSSPASIRMRRKNVEQIRQSFCDRDRVAEQLRPALAEDRRRPRSWSGYHSSSASSAAGDVRERPLHVRHAPAGGGVRVGDARATASGASASSSGGIQGMAGSCQALAADQRGRGRAARPGGRRGASRRGRRGSRGRRGRRARGGRRRCGGGRGRRPWWPRAAPRRSSSACRGPRARGRTPSRSCSSSRGCSSWRSRRARRRRARGGRRGRAGGWRSRWRGGRWRPCRRCARASTSASVR